MKQKAAVKRSNKQTKFDYIIKEGLEYRKKKGISMTKEEFRRGFTEFLERELELESE